LGAPELFLFSHTLALPLQTPAMVQYRKDKTSKLYDSIAKYIIFTPWKSS